MEAQGADLMKPKTAAAAKKQAEAVSKTAQLHADAEAKATRHLEALDAIRAKVRTLRLPTREACGDERLVPCTRRRLSSLPCPLSVSPLCLS